MKLYESITKNLKEAENWEEILKSGKVIQVSNDLGWKYSTKFKLVDGVPYFKSPEFTGNTWNKHPNHKSVEDTVRFLNANPDLKVEVVEDIDEEPKQEESKQEEPRGKILREPDMERAKGNVREWYMKEYPTDELGPEIKEDATFEDVFEALDRHEDFYDFIGVGDSIVRERIFEELADIMGTDYDYVYYQWLGESENLKEASNSNDVIVEKALNYITKEYNELGSDDYGFLKGKLTSKKSADDKIKDTLNYMVNDYNEIGGDDFNILYDILTQSGISVAKKDVAPQNTIFNMSEPERKERKERPLSKKQQILNAFGENLNNISVEQGTGGAGNMIRFVPEGSRVGIKAYMRAGKDGDDFALSFNNTIAGKYRDAIKPLTDLAKDTYSENLGASFPGDFEFYVFSRQDIPEMCNAIQSILGNTEVKESLEEMDNSNELTNIQFEEYCKDKLANLGTVEVENFDGDKISVKVAFEQKIRDYGNCKVLDSEDTMNKLDSDGETIEFVDEKGEYHNSPMASPITILSRLEFDKIDNNYYKSVIQYWDDLKDLFESEESDGAKTYYNSLKRMIADLDRKIETANEQEGQRLIDQRAELMDKLTRLEDTYGNKLNEANTTSPYIDVSEIVKYAEVYLRDKLNCDCSIRKTGDEQYQLIIPNTHEIISSWLELHDSLMENEKLNEADATDEEIELLKTILADLKNEPLIKKYLYDGTWLSGSSTTVYPIMVSGPGKEIEIQLNTDKNVFKNLLKKYEDKYPIYAYFWKSDGSCPSNLRFKLKESYNESERFVVNKTPYGFTEVSYKGYYISNMNGDTTVNINGDETLFNSVEEAIQTIDELDADPDYKYTDYSTDDEYNRIIQSHDVLRDNQKSKYNVFKTDDIEEVKKALSESADVDAIMSRYTAKNDDYNYVVDKCLEAYNRGDLENAYDAWCRIHDILLEKLDKYEAEHKDDIKDEEKFALYKEFQEYIDRIPKDAMYEITDYGKNKIYKEEGYYESEELKEKEDTINGCELRYRGSNPYIDSYHVYLDGEIIGNLEKHERDVKNNYYVAWFPKDYKMIYSPNATWETKSYSTVEEAINALKDYYGKSKNMNESEKPHAIDSWTYLD